MKKRFSLFASLSLVVVTLLSLVATQAASNSVAQSTAAATMAALGPTPTALPLSGDPILIGVALAQTGSSSLLGQDQVVGAKIAEAYFNQRGGVNGRPIKLVYQDAGSTPDTATQAFNTLINGNVVAIVGPTLSTQAFAADPVASKAGVPVLAPSNTAGGIPQLGAYVTRISAGVASYAVNAITLALKQNPGIKNVAVE
ncbi:MAG TPA: ABC transporter substrate-binding protein, partial [Aggregatilineales bacterium]|nr:ABC transporter substrate-binding protein [Aggregatilineales bacterium]